MPELRDIALYLRALEPRIAHGRLEHIRIASPFVQRSNNPPETQLEGRDVIGLRRIGKRIVIALRGGLDAQTAILDHFRAAPTRESHTLKRALTDPGLAAIDRRV